MTGIGQQLLDLQKAVKNGEDLSDEQVTLLSVLKRQENLGNQHIAVSKLALREGEELWDFMMVMMDAVQTDRIILADGSLDAWLHGIFDDHVIVQDGNTGRMFKSNFTREADGTIKFAEPVEVRMEWIEVTTPPAEDGVERSVEKRAPDAPEYVNVSKRGESKWGQLLPSVFRS